MLKIFAASVLVAIPGAFSAPQAAPAIAGLVVDTMEAPAPSRSRLPHLWTDAQGRLGLSWVEQSTQGTDEVVSKLWTARVESSGWSQPVSVATGTRWFVNWADYPAITSLSREHVLAHFLEKSGDGSYDYHVQLVRSSDAGKTWTKPVRLHTDEGPGEHGFVSIVPLSADSAAAMWLDGRNAVDHTAMKEGGATGLYARSIGMSGALGEEVLLDDRVCDCCPTAALRAPDGALVVAYRDRSQEEVRDISVVRWKEGRVVDPLWSSRDGWKILGCPVNGPALAMTGDRIGLAWFTLGTDGRSRVLCAFSEDGGRRFSLPLEIAGGRTEGRVDAVFDASGNFVVAWLELQGEGAEWRVARVVPGGGVSEAQRVVPTSGGRESGRARLALDRDGLVFAWTDVGAESRVELRRLSWK